MRGLNDDHLVLKQVDISELLAEEALQLDKLRVAQEVEADLREIQNAYDEFSELVQHQDAMNESATVVVRGRKLGAASGGATNVNPKKNVKSSHDDASDTQRDLYSRGMALVAELRAEAADTHTQSVSHTAGETEFDVELDKILKDMRRTRNMITRIEQLSLASNQEVATHIERAQLTRDVRMKLRDTKSRITACTSVAARCNREDEFRRLRDAFTSLQNNFMKCGASSDVALEAGGAQNLHAKSRDGLFEFVVTSQQKIAVKNNRGDTIGTIGQAVDDILNGVHVIATPDTAQPVAWFQYVLFLLQAGKGLTTLSLDFRQLGLTNVDAAALANVLPRMKELTVLDMSGNKLSDDGIVCIAKAAEKCASLQKIVIKGNVLPGGNSVGVGGMTALLAAVRANACITVVDLEKLISKLSFSKSIAELQSAINAQLKVNEQLQECRAFERIEREKQQAQLDALKLIESDEVNQRRILQNDENILRVGLGRKQSEVRVTVQKMLADEAERRTVAISTSGDHRYVLEKSEVVIIDVKTLKKLYSLPIGQGESVVDVRSAAHLVSSSCGSLSESLREARADYACFLVETNAPTLSSLDLRGHKIHSRGMRIAAGLATNTHLTSLNLSNNRLDDAGFQAIASALAKNRTLKKLSARGGFIPPNNKIANSALRVFAQSLQANTVLIELELPDDGSQDAQLKNVIQNCIGRNVKLATQQLNDAEAVVSTNVASVKDGGREVRQVPSAEENKVAAAVERSSQVSGAVASSSPLTSSSYQIGSVSAQAANATVWQQTASAKLVWPQECDLPQLPPEGFSRLASLLAATTEESFSKYTLLMSVANSPSSVVVPSLTNGIVYPTAAEQQEMEAIRSNNALYVYYTVAQKHLHAGFFSVIAFVNGAVKMGEGNISAIVGALAAVGVPLAHLCSVALGRLHHSSQKAKHHLLEQLVPGLVPSQQEMLCEKLARRLTLSNDPHALRLTETDLRSFQIQDVKDMARDLWDRTERSRLHHQARSEALTCWRYVLEGKLEVKPKTEVGYDASQYDEVAHEIAVAIVGERALNAESYSAKSKSSTDSKTTNDQATVNDDDCGFDIVDADEFRNPFPTARETPPATATVEAASVLMESSRDDDLRQKEEENDLFSNDLVEHPPLLAAASEQQRVDCNSKQPETCPARTADVSSCPKSEGAVEGIVSGVDDHTWRKPAEAHVDATSNKSVEAPLEKAASPMVAAPGTFSSPPFARTPEAADARQVQELEKRLRKLEQRVTTDEESEIGGDGDQDFCLSRKRVVTNSSGSRVGGFQTAAYRDAEFEALRQSHEDAVRQLRQTQEDLDSLKRALQQKHAKEDEATKKKKKWLFS